jgi:alkanesulfonate monooxygenase SsuD/methylene tetrahydromethanopterin reductase-like flavin-dependent oxidoreductase (luciferase family)
MRVGLLAQTAEEDSGRVLGVEEVTGQIVRAEQLGFDSAWVADHLFIETPTGRVTGHDPMVHLAHAAARTQRILLGTLVACTAFRSAGQLAREAAALAEASQGRFVLGIGAGWHKPEFDAFDYPFDHRVGRFEEHLNAIERLLAGGPVTYEGQYVRLLEAEVLMTAPPPPLWVAGKGPRMLRLTAGHAAGWNLAWGGLDPSWLAAPLATLDRELKAVKRDRDSFTVSAGFCWTPEAGTAALAAALRSYEALGVDLAILCLAEGPAGRTAPEYLERAAEVMALR